MQKLTITNAYYTIFKQRTCKAPRERFVKYYEDLYALYGGKLSDKSFCEGLQLSYAELGSSVLDWCQNKQLLNNLDLIVCAYWAAEFDPDYGSCGAYFAEKYNLNCTMFDICDQGTSATFTGLNVISKYFAHGNYKKALLLMLEQTTIPRDKANNCLIPTMDAAAVLVLENKGPEQQGSQLLLTEVFCKQSLVKNGGLQKFIQGKCNLFNIPEGSVRITLKEKSELWQSYESQLKQENKICHLMELVGEVGCASTVIYISNNIRKDKNSRALPANKNAQYIMLFDEDVESDNVGFMLIKI